MLCVSINATRAWSNRVAMRVDLAVQVLGREGTLQYTCRCEVHMQYSGRNAREAYSTNLIDGEQGETASSMYLLQNPQKPAPSQPHCYERVPELLTLKQTRIGQPVTKSWQYRHTTLSHS